MRETVGGHRSGLSRSKRTGLRGFASLSALLLCALFFSPASAAKIYPSAGSTSATFLKIDVGARAVGMGGAYTAVAEGPYAMYWNPAGLASLGYRSLVFNHNDYFSGMGQEYAAYAWPAAGSLLPDGGLRTAAAGVSLNYFYTGGGLERRSGLYEAGNNISPVEGHFGAYDMALSFGYGSNRSSVLRTGAAVKLIRQSIDNESALGVGLDLGMLYDFEWLGRKFTAGAALQNLGPGIKFSKRAYGLPLALKTGLSHRLAGGTLLALDLDKPVDNYPSIALGAEQPLAGRLLLRGGYRYRQNGNEDGGMSGLSFGVGFVSGRFTFDYALAPFGVLGNTQRLSATMRFLEPGERKARDAVRLLPAPAAISGGGRLKLAFVQKPLALSRSGVSLLVRGTAAGTGDDKPGLSAVSFVLVTRSQAAAGVEVSGGQLPEKLLAEFPAGSAPETAWQLAAVPYGIQGDIKLEFRSAARTAGEMGVYYLSGEGWKEVRPAAGPCGDRTCAYSASAPVSSYYAVGLKALR